MRSQTKPRLERLGDWVTEENRKIDRLPLKRVQRLPPSSIEATLVLREFAISRELRIPGYLEQVYWWAYVHPNAVRLFERKWLVNAILFGNYGRLRDAALNELGGTIEGKTLQVACVCIGQLARVSHVNLFGISIIFLLTGGIFAMSELSVRPRVAILILPYAAIWADIGPWWITKYAPIFSWVVLVGGAVMGLMLAAQIFISLWEMWFKKSRLATALTE